MWLSTVHTRLNYSLGKSVGLGLGACNYEPRFTSCMVIGQCMLFNNDVVTILPPFTYSTFGCLRSAHMWFGKRKLLLFATI